ncbi:DUF4190 domain-containing protein [Microbacterium sp. CFBP9034]|uniref:DUF4190 domain-containing protein n=1 Tax=Microbacterium sp. CFBP9034 TaxID=3096540 RepID=UPI002A6AD419|nr:DUF4190 domain-containing protein [Microbacterium sp. CFBP9034]MDY0909198.1 DUF4190 domain-containing protein [Microbacterium sp. CFBP9034]
MSDPQNPAPPPDGGIVPPPPAYTPDPTPPHASAGAPSAAPAYSQQAYPSAPPPAYGAPASPTVPGKTLGIVAFILSFFIQLVALILGIVALVQSKKAGHKNGWAVAAIIISSVLMVLGVILFFAVVLPLLTFSSEALQACQAVGFEGTVTVAGIPIDCSNVR